MAIQFPNFLGQLLKPDYSGVGDVFENYYKGRNMPNEALIKQIEAEFARPNAETNLANAKISGANQRLTGAQTALQIQQLRQQLAEQAQMEEAIRNALRQGGGATVAGNGQPVMPNAASMSTALGNPQQVATMPRSPRNDVIPLSELNNPQTMRDRGYDVNAGERKFQKFNENGSVLPSNEKDTLHGLPRSVFQLKNPSNIDQLAPRIAQNMQPQPAAAAPVTSPALSPAGEPIKINGVTPEQTPALLEPAKTTEANETVISKGSPHLYGIDALYENNPAARPSLEKKGYKRTVQTKFDNKTGTTTILTTHPSGKITELRSAPLTPASEGIPLTNAMITQHQNVIAGVDNVIPVLEHILELGGGEKLDEKGAPAGKNKDVFQPYPRSSGWKPGMGWVPGWMSDAANYESLVTSASEPLVKALGYPKTNEGIEKAVQQVLTTHGETNYRYIQRIKKLIEELEKKKAYSEKEVKRSNKVSPIANQITGSNIPDSGNYEDLTKPEETGEE